MKLVHVGIDFLPGEQRTKKLVCSANLADMACTNISQVINVISAVTHTIHAPQNAMGVNPWDLPLEAREFSKM